MEFKYFKPTSLTWWGGFIPLIAGLSVASVDLHGLTGVVNTINGVTGGMSAAIMINAGLISIGLRGKDG